MIKEEKPIFLKVFLIIAFIFLINVGVLFIKYRNLSEGITGMSIKEVIPKTYQEISPISKTFLIVQWIFLIVVLFFVLVRDKGIKNRKNEIRGIDIKKMKKKQDTDLDALYNILKEKKQLRVSSIAKIFNIKKSVAMEWAKILESGNLVIINHPTRNEPLIEIVTKKK